MKVIFLDIDGVLNLRRKQRDNFGTLFHKPWVDNLARIVYETGARIVISSTWRLSGLKTMEQMWQWRDLPGIVIDVTPHFHDKELNIPRGLEIDHWLTEKAFQRINWSRDEQIKYLERSQVKNYIILDDDSDMLYKQREHFLQCSLNHSHKGNIGGYGLTKELTDHAIHILNQSIIELYY